MENKFWAWSKNEDTDERVLTLDGYIHDWDWFDELIKNDDDGLNTPKEFKQELNSATGDIILNIKSPGGNIFSAAEIYAMLKEYKGGKITVQIPSFAASAATIIAMAGDTVEISPLAFMMIHNPFLDWVQGEEKDMLDAAKYLADLKENIINAYELKTKLPRQQISDMMDAETYMNAKKAVELHFADKLMFDESEKMSAENLKAEMFSPRKAVNSLAHRIKNYHGGKSSTAPKNHGKGLGTPTDRVDAQNLYKRLALISH